MFPDLKQSQIQQAIYQYKNIIHRIIINKVGFALFTNLVDYISNKQGLKC